MPRKARQARLYSVTNLLALRVRDSRRGPLTLAKPSPQSRCATCAGYPGLGVGTPPGSLRAPRGGPRL